MEVPEEVCLSVPVSSTRDVCNPVTREECDVIEKTQTEEKCDLIRQEVPTQRVCEYRPR